MKTYLKNNYTSESLPSFVWSLAGPVINSPWSWAAGKCSMAGTSQSWGQQSHLCCSGRCWCWVSHQIFQSFLPTCFQAGFAGHFLHLLLLCFTPAPCARALLGRFNCWLQVPLDPNHWADHRRNTAAPIHRGANKHWDGSSFKISGK